MRTKVSLCVFTMFVMVAAMSHPAEATSITFSFANGQLTDGFYDFDVMAQAGAEGTQIGDVQVYINYSTAGFGDNVAANNKITVTKGTLLQGTLGTSELYTIANIADNTASRFAVTVDFAFDGTGLGNTLPVTSTQLLHIKLEIADKSQTSGLTFEQALMDGQQYEQDASTKYSPVNVGGTLDDPLPVELSLFEAQVTDDGVRLKWQTQSEKNNLGFHVYRSKTRTGDYERVTPGLIEGSGTDATNHEYAFLDEDVEEGQVYWYLVEDVDFFGQTHRSTPIEVEFKLVKDLKQAPVRSALLQNYPNPFNPETWIPFQIAKRGDVQIRIYNLHGALVRSLDLGSLDAGRYLDRTTAAYWDGRDSLGEKVASGIYFYQLVTLDFQQTKRLVILK